MKLKIIPLLYITTVLLVAGCSEDDSVHKQDIVHINLEDARAGYNQPFPLDIDNDGDSEFVFNATLIADAVGDHLRFAIISRYDNEVLGVNGNVKVLPDNEPISQTSSFGHDNEVLVVKTTTDNGTTWWGNWKGVQNKYVGVCFSIDGSTSYGWIKISINEPNEEVVIHDMAYGKRIGMNGILAGDGGE